ncbi:chemoreceptor glutamine deamidase CheD [Treponema sp.]
MNEQNYSRFDKPALIIHAGEYYASAKDEIIGTVLGSCIAVALRDTELAVGGLNHFMLPKALEKHTNPLISKNASYGLYAMELLINELLSMGCRRERLVAKVFGGASVLDMGNKGSNSVPQSNIDFVFSFLDVEKIPILSSDTGGKEARRIFFFPRSGKVLLKRIPSSILSNLSFVERAYRHRIRKKEAKAGEITLFSDD